MGFESSLPPPFASSLASGPNRKLSDLQAITVRTVCGKEFEFHVERSRNVGYLKQQIAKKGKGSVDVEDQELIFDGEELEDQRLINDICTSNDAVIHLLVRKSAEVGAKPIEKDFPESFEALNLNEKKPALAREIVGCQALERKAIGRELVLEPLIGNPDIEFSLGIKKLISSTLDGLERGCQPVSSSEGTGGTYFMPDSSGLKYVSVFKPIDEEPMAMNNPRGLTLSLDGEGLKKGTRVGEGALREVAAYILDHPRTGPRTFYNEEKGVAGVPPTIMVKCLHKGFNHPEGYDSAAKNMKIGSLQMFMKNNGSCEDIGPGAFPVHEVHKISMLDMRLANADRHAGNILMSRQSEDSQIVLIPIDHGYCLPENFGECTFDWLSWPQAKQHYQSESLNYIQSLDAEKDIDLLRFFGWNLPPECARTLRIATMLLKKGAERGLTPFDIGSIMCLETSKKEPAIELIIKEAKELPGTSEASFLESLSSIMDRHLDEL